MIFKNLIRKKRDGFGLTREELEFFARGLTDSSIPDEQVAAFAMAVFYRSMEPAETGALTAAMADSGLRLRWDELRDRGPVIDKHSTGGVGDKVSFLLAPIAAACGCFVPMISGRGLGHTGGTLDKLDAVPGYRSMPTVEDFRRVVGSVGCAIIGQTDELAPADRRLYAIRDVTATVESIPLITASILSKKIAAGLDALVMDIKTGSGAFMETPAEARALARSIIGVAGTTGLKTHALVTDMSQTLGWTVGNALEIAEAVEFLNGGAREPRLEEVVFSLVAEMLVMGRLADDHAQARVRAEAAVRSGEAAQRFERMIAELGGPRDLLSQSARYLPRAPIVEPIFPVREGYVSDVDARAVGNVLVGLGGGRRIAGETLDLAVGLSEVAAIGVRVGRDRPLAMLHARTHEQVRQAADALRAATSLSDRAVSPPPIVHEILVAT
ncbi:MAG TPA: thymidine phosphorylase [Steroidobacteraceae bacterium]|jgi:thymidine phosphorylase|nr:thymidine phosphorylase [Steroidobacteraceae bacterium]